MPSWFALSPTIWYSASVRNVSCVVCKADDYHVLFPKNSAYGQAHRIVKCNHCGLMYANPQEVVDCENYAQGKDLRPIDPDGPDRQYIQKQHVQIPDYDRALRVLNEICPNRGKLLEIGTYLGILLDRCRSAGWDTTGLEPCGPAVDYARSKYKLNIVHGTLTDGKLPEAHFDAVMMLHVIEHMPDPTENVRQIRRIMRPGGVLVVETPRFDSLMFKILGRHERSINNCPGHLFFFTVPLLRRLLEQCGFEPIRVDLVGRTLTLDRLVFNIGMMSRNTLLRNWTFHLGPKLGLDKVKVHLNARDMQRIYARAK